MARTILIVEDEDRTMTPFHALLDAHGYDTLRTRHSAEALDLALSRRPDLILIELNSPDQPRLQLARRIKADRALGTIPLLAITDRASASQAKRIRDEGCDGYLARPISLASFVQTLETFVH